MAYVYVIRMLCILLHQCYTVSTAPPMTPPTITGITPLSSTSFIISWTITDPDHNYIVTWINLRTGMMYSITVPENTNSFMMTALNGVDNYNVIVITNNSCGTKRSDPFTIYGKYNAKTKNIVWYEIRYVYC